MHNPFTSITRGPSVRSNRYTHLPCTLHYTCNINVHYDGAYEPTNDEKLQTFFPSQIKNISLSFSRSLSLQVFTTTSNENVSNFEKEKRGHEICEYPSKIWKYFSGSFGGGTIFTRIRGTNSIKNRTKVFVERRKLFSRRGRGGGKGIIFVSFLIGKGIFPPIP